MRTPEEIFDEFIHAHGIGRRFQPDHTTPAVERKFIDRQTTTVRGMIDWFQPKNPATPPVHFGLIDDMRLNALCFEVDGREFLGFNRGVMLLIYDLFLRMLSHPDVLPRIGNAAGESASDYHQEGLSRNFIDLLNLRSQRKGDPRPPLPVDVDRQLCAGGYAQLAVEFLAAHEMAHLFRGHRRYFEAKTGMPFFMELDAEDQPAISPLARQALEVDADLTAAQLLFKMHLDCAASDVMPWERDSPKERMFSWLFSVFSLFHLLGLGADPAKMLTSTHPPRAVRMMLVHDEAWGTVKHYDPKLEGDFLLARGEAVKEAGRATQILCGGRPPQWMDSFAETARSGAFMDHKKRVVDQLSLVMPEVGRLAGERYGEEARTER